MRKKNGKAFYFLFLTLTSAILILSCRAFAVHTKSTLHSDISYHYKVQSNYSILIDLNERRIYLLNNGKLVRKYPCAVGSPETPSPIGSFKITEKHTWGEGFGGYWMGINCIWGKYGIHGTLSPWSIGTASSHGCFRMYSEDAQELYETIPVGTPVCVTGGCFGAFGDGYRVIMPYMYGYDVMVVQERMKKLGYFNGYCSGRYDTEYFKTAIHKFQHDNGLPLSDNIDLKMLNALNFMMMD